MGKVRGSRGLALRPSGQRPGIGSHHVRTISAHPEAGPATQFAGLGANEKCRAPCSKCVKNFKAETTEHESEPRLFGSEGPYVTVQAADSGH